MQPMAKIVGSKRLTFGVKFFFLFFLVFDIWTSIIDFTIFFSSYSLLLLFRPYTMERYSSIFLLIVFVIKNSSNPFIPHSHALPLCLYPFKKMKNTGRFYVSLTKKTSILSAHSFEPIN